MLSSCECAVGPLVSQSANRQAANVQTSNALYPGQAGEAPSQQPGATYVGIPFQRTPPPTFRDDARGMSVQFFYRRGKPPFAYHRVVIRITPFRHQRDGSEDVRSTRPPAAWARPSQASCALQCTPNRVHRRPPAGGRSRGWGQHIARQPFQLPVRAHPRPQRPPSLHPCPLPHQPPASPRALRQPSRPPCDGRQLFWNLG